MTRRAALPSAKRSYAAVAHGAGRLLRAGRLVAAPPPRQHRIRHWAYSLTAVHDPVGLVALDVPWWTYRAIGVVESWLRERPGPVRVFEYGSGASTVWLARRATEVWSAEHDRDFAHTVRTMTAGLPNVHLLVVEPVPSGDPAVPSAKAGFGGLDFADYAASIDQASGDFDLVVVDGRARSACLEKATQRLRPGGIIVFDNSRRRRYRAAIRDCGLQERRLGGLTPTLPYPDQTSVLTGVGIRA